MAKKVTAIRARRNLGELLEKVYYKGDQFIIERAGKPMAAVIPLWQLEEWRARNEQILGLVDESKGKPSSGGHEPVI